MKRELVEKWADALESGDYEQGQSYLKIHHEREVPCYCCLGVLCEIFGKKFVNGPMSYNPEVFYYDDFSYIHTIQLDGILLKEVGMQEKEMMDLICMNDDQGKNFIEIAEYIRENLITEE